MERRNREKNEQKHAKRVHERERERYLLLMRKKGSWKKKMNREKRTEKRRVHLLMIGYE